MTFWVWVRTVPIDRCSRAAISGPRAPSTMLARIRRSCPLSASSGPAHPTRRGSAAAPRAAPRHRPEVLGREAGPPGADGADGGGRLGRRRLLGQQRECAGLRRLHHPRGSRRRSAPTIGPGPPNSSGARRAARSAATERLDVHGHDVRPQRRHPIGSSGSSVRKAATSRRSGCSLRCGGERLGEHSVIVDTTTRRIRAGWRMAGPPPWYRLRGNRRAEPAEERPRPAGWAGRRPPAWSVRSAGPRVPSAAAELEAGEADSSEPGQQHPADRPGSRTATVPSPVTAAHRLSRDHLAGGRPPGTSSSSRSALTMIAAVRGRAGDRLLVDVQGAQAEGDVDPSWFGVTGHGDRDHPRAIRQATVESPTAPASFGGAGAADDAGGPAGPVRGPG